MIDLIPYLVTQVWWRLRSQGMILVGRSPWFRGRDLMQELTFRRAGRDDVVAIVAMLAEDALGATRESPGDLAPYLAAFDAID